MLICSLFNPNNIYVQVTFSTGHMEFPFIDSIQHERDDWEQLGNLEGVYKDFSKPDDSQEEESQDNYDGSFHRDESNKDDEDDDLRRMWTKLHMKMTMMRWRNM